MKENYWRKGQEKKQQLHGPLWKTTGVSDTLLWHWTLIVCSFVWWKTEDISYIMVVIYYIYIFIFQDFIQVLFRYIFVCENTDTVIPSIHAQGQEQESRFLMKVLISSVLARDWMFKEQESRFLAIESDLIDIQL